VVNFFARSQVWLEILCGYWNLHVHLLGTEDKNLFLIMWNLCDTIKVHLILIVAIHICTSAACGCSDLTLFKYITNYKFILYVILFPPSPLWCIYLNLFFLFSVTSWSCLTTMFCHSFNASSIVYNLKYVLLCIIYLSV